METKIHLIISRSVRLRMRNVSEEICRENQNVFCVKKNFFENRAVYDIMWKNIVQPGRPQMTIWRMRVAWIRKSTNIHNEYVILIAFPWQQCLHERAPVLCYSYTVCLVSTFS